MIKKMEKKDELMSKLIVQKSKPLFGLWVSHLTLNGAKLLDVYLAKINSHDETTRMVTFKKSELEEILGMKRIKAEDLKPALNRLMDKYAIAEILNGRKHYILVNLFDIAHMEFDENGVTMVRMHCSEPAKKYFFNIEEYQYVSYSLKKIIPLKSMYTYNMFLLLQLYRWKKSFKLTLKKLRECLGCVKSKEIDPENKDKDVFLEFKRFNDKVLKVTQKELAERVNYKFTYEAVKTGKNVVSVIFYLNLDPPEITSTAREIKENKKIPEQTNMIREKEKDTKYQLKHVMSFNRICNHAHTKQTELENNLTTLKDNYSDICPELRGEKAKQPERTSDFEVTEDRMNELKRAIGINV